MKHRLTAAGALMAIGAFVLTGPGFAETVPPVTDPLGVLVLPKGAPLEIGGYWVLSGPDAGLGVDQKRGVELAIEDWKKTLVGHPIVLDAQDSQCSAEGGQLAATKLASNPNTVVVIGPSCSSEATPAAPILWKAGIVDIGTSSTAPSLTAAGRSAGFHGFARTAFSDADQGKGDGNYIFSVMKAKKVVTIHDGSPYASQLVAEFVKTFTALGGTVLSQEAIQPTDVDMHPLLTRIAAEKPDVIYMPIFVAAAGQIARQAKTTTGLEKTQLIGGGSLMTGDIITAAGDAVLGMKITYPDISPEAMGKGYPDFVEKYKTAYGEPPISGWHAMAYDAAAIAFKAIEKVAKTDDEGTTYIGKQALRDAIFATDTDGISGRMKCDADGECAQFHLGVYEYVNTDPTTFKIGDNPKKIYP
ncbi:branched-chain amino acid ABC transporter substrate-binding protein [Mesorhizobium sp. INR15]|uniref:branched-chain amino acid ABC transporter substrate-binding protein n=1 Tax=Mesorhizobium sp. INR15 TaxID=2654248 RepID=UPI0018969D16|nr:branched-chain amino acid ABC transporter substrate-binding protein [Mesorhizobium sp. INR15]QPC92614.1 ABC transporter substrate-binding protein [Mesorhizobium sp. INR15]